MEKSLILVINPCHSLLGNQIAKLLDPFVWLDYFVVDSIDFSNMKSSPALIIVLLDTCSGRNLEGYGLLELPRSFPSTPILSIINPDLECRHCMNCRKFAWSFYPIPIGKQDIDFIISWYVENQKIKEPESSELYLKQRSMLDIFIGESTEVSNVKKKIIKIAPYDVTVLLQGETGCGKELSARLIHYLGGRSKGPFIAVNCGAIPNELFENELFGHKRGAYTNADCTERGLIQDADTGTLFLDEIESLPMSSQVKLLRFVDEKKYKPLGQPSYLTSDVRIISASNQDLMKLVEEGKFREDLFYRLSVVNIFIPPLRDRKEDIPYLVWHFVERFAKLYSKKIKTINPEAMMRLTYSSWPGNVRELENMLQEAVILCPEDKVELDNLNFGKYNEGNYSNSDMVLKSFQNTKKQINEEFEKTYLNILLKIFKGNIKKASGFAKKDRSELYRLMKKHKIEPNIYRSI